MQKKTEKINNNCSNSAFFLADGLAVAKVEELAHGLSILSEQPEGPFVIDASGTRVVSTAGVQWLLALGRELAARGSRLVLQQPTTELRESMRLLGLEPQLNEWVAV